MDSVSKQPIVAILSLEVHPRTAFRLSEHPQQGYCESLTELHSAQHSRVAELSPGLPGAIKGGILSRPDGNALEAGVGQTRFPAVSFRLLAVDFVPNFQLRFQPSVEFLESREMLRAPIECVLSCTVEAYRFMSVNLLDGQTVAVLGLTAAPVPKQPFVLLSFQYRRKRAVHVRRLE